MKQLQDMHHDGGGQTGGEIAATIQNEADS
jgi:hypothetical protein